MALNVPLSQLISDVRAETGRALTPALGAGERDHLIYLLRRTQETIANEASWEHLVVNRDIALGASQRYAAYPADLPFEAITSVHTLFGSQWAPVPHGIGPCEYGLTNSDIGIVGSPVQRWQHISDTNSIEVWPVPSQAATIRLRGQRKLRPLVDDTDTCDLDSTLIVLRAAVELLARDKAEDAQLKAQEARQYQQRLLAKQIGAKAEPFVMGGGRHRSLRPYIDYMP